MFSCPYPANCFDLPISWRLAVWLAYDLRHQSSRLTRVFGDIGEHIQHIYVSMFIERLQWIVLYHNIGLYWIVRLWVRESVFKYCVFQWDIYINEYKKWKWGFNISQDSHWNIQVHDDNKYLEPRQCMKIQVSDSGSG